MRLDVLVKMDAAGATGDDKLHAAWEAASQFKKRYMEHKAELDTIRLAAARMQVGRDFCFVYAMLSFAKIMAWVLAPQS